MRTIQLAMIFSSFVAAGCGELADELSPSEPSPPTPAESAGAMETTAAPVPVVDKESRSVRYALDCAGGAEPQLKMLDKRTLTLSCPEPGGRRLKVVCQEGVEITKLGGGGFDFQCR
jgi:hypothetical protein